MKSEIYKFTIFLILISMKAFAFEVPSFQGNVLDQANVLSLEEVQTIKQSIQVLRDSADIWAMVYILNSTGDIAIEDAAEKTFKKWEIGKKGKDNGLLIIVAIKDRKMRIETG